MKNFFWPHPKSAHADARSDGRSQALRPSDLTEPDPLRRSEDQRQHVGHYRERQTGLDEITRRKGFAALQIGWPLIFELCEC